MDERRARRWLPVAAAAAVVALVGGTVALSRGGDDEPQRRGAALRDHDRSELVWLTADVPCPQRTFEEGQAGASEADNAIAAVTAVRCMPVEQRIPGEGKWQVELRQVATSGLEGFQRALALPDVEATGEVACRLYADGLPATVLVDGAGEAAVAAPPRDGCHHVRPEVLAAYDAITWATVSERRVRQTLTPEAERAGCSMDWKNELMLLADQTPPSAGGLLPNVSPEQVTVCVYEVSAEEPDVGHFVRSLVLDPQEMAELLKAMTGAGPTASCPAAGSFAVIHLRNDKWIDVELDGCRRLIGPDGHVGTADDLSLLTG